VKPFGKLTIMLDRAIELNVAEVTFWQRVEMFNPAVLHLQSITDVPGEVGAQGKAHGQATAAVDVPHPASDAYIPRHMDTECASNSRADPRPGRPAFQAMFVQLVGPQPGHW